MAKELNGKASSVDEGNTEMIVHCGVYALEYLIKIWQLAMMSEFIPEARRQSNTMALFKK